MRRLAIVMFASAVAATGAYAEPAPDDQVARQHYDRGKQLADGGQFAAAYDEFSAGFDASPRPQFLFNMAECQRALGDPARARELYQRFVAASPNDPLAVTARTRLADLPAPVAPAVPPAPSSAITPKVESPPPVAPPVAMITATPSSGSHVVPLVLGVGALAAGGGALAFDLMGDSTYARAKAATDPVQQSSLWHSANTQRYAAEGLGVAGLACAGAAVWFYLRGDRRETTARHVHLVPTTNGVAVLGLY